MTSIKNQASIAGKPTRAIRDARVDVAFALPFFVGRDRRMSLRVSPTSELYVNAKGELDRLDTTEAAPIISTTYGRNS